jgi:hypothetical protein
MMDEATETTVCLEMKSKTHAMEDIMDDEKMMMRIWLSF